MVNCANVINHFIFVFFLYFFLSPLLPRRSVYCFNFEDFTGCFNFEDFTDQVSQRGGYSGFQVTGMIDSRAPVLSLARYFHAPATQARIEPKVKTQKNP